MLVKISAIIAVPLSDKSKIQSYYNQVKQILKQHLQKAGQKKWIKISEKSKGEEFPDVVIDRVGASLTVEAANNTIVKLQQYCIKNKLKFEHVSTTTK